MAFSFPHRLVLVTTAAVGVAAHVGAATLSSQQLSFQTRQQSQWGSGDGFAYDYQRFIGLAVDPAAWDFSLPRVQGSIETGPITPNFDYRVDSYFNFDTAFRLGMEVGARLNGGTLDARLDYGVAYTAPDRIVKGEAFSIGAQYDRLGASSFNTVAPTAEAHVDGIVDMYLGAYMRFTTYEDLGTHDYRMGRDGFTDNGTNRPYKTLANVDLSPEIVSFNRGGNGQLRVVGTNQGGVGASYAVGATTITAGDWRVNPVGQVQGATLHGSDETTVLTATLDVDQLALAGSPALGTGIDHDWGVIAIDMGYEIVDVKTSLSMGLKQDLTIDSALEVRLLFSEAVLIDGEQVTEFRGTLDNLPALTLLGDRVTVTPEYRVQAQLHNQTALSFAAGAALTVLEAHAKIRYDVRFLGSGRSGSVADRSFGPYYDWRTTVPLGDIDVYDQRFALLGFETITGESFLLSAVPEPSLAVLWLAGLASLGGCLQRCRSRPIDEA